MLVPRGSNHVPPKMEEMRSYNVLKPRSNGLSFHEFCPRFAFFPSSEQDKSMWLVGFTATRSSTSSAETSKHHPIILERIRVQKNLYLTDLVRTHHYNSRFMRNLISGRDDSRSPDPSASPSATSVSFDLDALGRFPKGV
ncbi:hypothetical protein AVEN_140354-1 [Araneus ventricosus]|uniref:Uncharacterized protein n=1 Tax=Araneus ventricosus TaxID=182803 RepID=A0A4Y2M0T7_ARAVE|nr:hypothetical protein AVEN_140354-1 [Araneus ventricosus]